MKADIYVALPPNAELPLRTVRLRNGTLEEVPATALRSNGQTTAIAFAPASSVGRFRIPLPMKSHAEAHRVALYAIEDDLAQPVEDVVLTLGAREPTTRDRDVYVVDQHLMKAWRDQLCALGLEHAPIIAESSLDSDRPAIFDFGDRRLLFAPGRTFSIDSYFPEDAVAALTEAAGLTGVAITRADALATCIDLHERNSGVGLRYSGSGSNRSAQLAGLRGWMLTGALAGIGIAIWLSTVWLETRVLEQRAQQLEDTARAAFSQQFPGASVPVDIHSEVRRMAQLAASQQTTGFRPLSSVLYDAIAGSETIHLKRLSYVSGEQALRAHLEFANRADETAFSTRLDTAGWKIETEQAVDGPKGVDITLTMRAR